MDSLLDDEAVLKWLAPYESSSQQTNLSYIRDFMLFVEKENFHIQTPIGLIEFQKNVDKNQEYLLLDLLQKYILEKKGTRSSKLVRYSKVKTFFLRNRAGLPDDDFKIKAERSPIKDKVEVDVIRSLISIADLGFKAFYLTLWTGILDQERFYQFNSKYGFELGRHLKEKGIDEPFMIEFDGRKQTKNQIIFHTYLGRDALYAWREYFERIRGYPNEGEAALVNDRGKRFVKGTMPNKHLRLLAKLNYIQREKGRGVRYGFGLHNFRDAAKTLLHLEGKKDGLDLDCVDYWMGHVTDPNQYDKFYRDKNYSLEQYRIAEKHLNIISGKKSSLKTDEDIKIMKKELEELRGLKKFLERDRPQRPRLMSPKDLVKLMATPEFQKEATNPRHGIPVLDYGLLIRSGVKLKKTENGESRLVSISKAEQARSLSNIDKENKKLQKRMGADQK